MDRNEDLCRWLSLALGLVLAFAWAAKQNQFAAVCDQVREDTLRLHIVASSDTVADQSLKLRVRDAVLQETARLCKNAPNQEAAKEILSGNLSQITHVAGRILSMAGRPMVVKAEMETGYFTTSHYPGATLPAGSYDALRITLGEGNGHNWWCCLYPTLCLSAATATYAEESENTVVTAGGFEVRFALVEWWEKITNQKERIVHNVSPCCIE